MTVVNQKQFGTGMFLNALRTLASVFPGYFPGVKHNHYFDYGYPENLTFAMLHHMYSRNSIAYAAVDKTVSKVWQTNPEFVHDEDTYEQTPEEKQFADAMERIRGFQKLKETHRRSLVGRFAVSILRVADGRKLSQPLGKVRNGGDGLVDIIPVWEGQVEVLRFDEDETSPRFGLPVLYGFNESALLDSEGKSLMKRVPRRIDIHWTRVILWSSDGTTEARSLLGPGYNDLLDIEKVSGAGGEAFWKNAKGGAVLKMDPETDVESMMRAMAVSTDSEFAEKINEQFDKFNKGLDNTVLTQGITVEHPFIKMPSPEHFKMGPLQNFCASVSMPVKIMIGTQSGERASSEDASEWEQTCMARRGEIPAPAITEFISRMKECGVIAEGDWKIKWEDLTEGTFDEKIERSRKMSESNRLNNRMIFSPDELRDVVKLGPAKHEIEQLTTAPTETPGDGGNQTGNEPPQPQQ